MSNNYFQFKQFIIQQKHCAMKVCTDACLFGAHISNTYSGSTDKNSRILDIGTGTGLLSLMLGQNHPGIIDAVEIDPAAAKQAGENMAVSPWQDRLRILETDIKDFHPPHAYDLIISNPPFYETDLPSDNLNVNLARHAEGLSFEDLLACVNRLLKKEGVIAVLLTAKRKDYFTASAESHGLHLYKQVMVKQTPHHAPFRAILYFSRKQEPLVSEEIIIKEETTYSDAFKLLLKDYYLDL